MCLQAARSDVTCKRTPSLSTSGETLTIEESMNLEGENGERRRVETSTNGAGAAVEAAAAGREDQRGLAGLGFGAGGRVAPEGVPDPELVEQAKRRTFTAKYKLEILAKADACTKPGDVGELLRREGLYTSHLTYWRKQRPRRRAEGARPVPRAQAGRPPRWGDRRAASPRRACGG